MKDLIEKAAEDLKNAKHAIALTGAGISTESGIRDFRVHPESGVRILRQKGEPIKAMENSWKTQRHTGKRG